MFDLIHGKKAAAVCRDVSIGARRSRRGCPASTAVYEILRALPPRGLLIKVTGRLPVLIGWVCPSGSVGITMIAQFLSAFPQRINGDAVGP